MGKQFAELSSKHIEFIEKQKIYFVATAAQTGSVNLSPKGGDSLRVISSSKIAWLNLTGSGNESASHVLQDPRMTIPKQLQDAGFSMSRSDRVQGMKL